MARLALKPLLGTIAGATALTVIQTSTAVAAVLNYAFQVEINQGAYAGIHKGTFQFDDSKLVPCSAPLEDPGSPNQCATPGASNLAVTFDFMGVTYTHRNDVDYVGTDSDFPAVYLLSKEQERIAGTPFVLSFIVMFPEVEKNFAILGNVFRTGFPTTQAADKKAYDVGYVRYFLKPGTNPGEPSSCQLLPGSCNPAAVPEPSEIAGSVVGLGILGLIARSRRKRRNFKP